MLGLPAASPPPLPSRTRCCCCPEVLRALPDDQGWVQLAKGAPNDSGLSGGTARSVYVAL